MQDMDYEVVPALAKAVEARMEELKLTPTDLKRATGLSYTVLDHVRKGYRKKYGKGLKWAVCDALQWSNDSLDRILAGKKPIVLEPPTDEDETKRGKKPTPPALRDQVVALAGQVAALADQVDKLSGELQTLRHVLPSGVRQHETPAQRLEEPAR